MTPFLERHSENIEGVLSCFDRIILQGTLPDICHPSAITRWFYAKEIRIFDFKNWAAPMRDRIRENIETLAKTNGLEIEFIRKCRDFRKEQRVREIVDERGDEPGIVHIFSAMESCTAFQPWHDKQSHKTFFKYDTGKCLHYYVYFIDQEFGLCYLRIPTWAPFRLQFYMNGHNWLVRQLQKKGIGYRQVENALVRVDDMARAQKISDRFPVKRLHRMLDACAKKFCPVVREFGAGIHWSVMQAEYATDIIFSSDNVLAPVYEELIRTLMHAVKPESVSMFLGKRLHGRFDGELGTEFRKRKEGRCLRHYMGPCGIKMYDKFGRVLRIETFSNDISFFKHHRRVEHRDGSYNYQNAPMRKTIHSLPDLSELMCSCNRRYLEFLASVDDPTPGIRNVNRLSRPVRRDGRNHRGFNLFDTEDETVLRTIAQGDAQSFGIRNQTLRAALGKTSAQVSRIIKRLRNHGLIKKAANVYKYYLTAFGRQVVATSLKLKELFIIPNLRGVTQQG